MKLLIIALSASLIALAELGDKTQLATITLSVKYPPKKIFLGAASSYVLLTALAIIVGTVLFEIIPQVWLKIITAGFFIIFGIFTIIQAANKEEIEASKKRGSPFWIAFSLIFITELGDKTQLLTIALAAKYKAPLEVFIGALIGLWLLALLSAYLGKVITGFVKDIKLIHRMAGAIFILLGLVSLVR